MRSRAPRRSCCWGPATLVDVLALKLRVPEQAKIERCVDVEDAARALGLDAGRVERAVEPEDAGSLEILGAVPAGPWSDRFLLDAAASIADDRTPVLERPREAPPVVSSLAISRGAPRTAVPPVVDYLFAAHPEYLDGEVLGSVRSGGTIVVHCRAASAQEVWAGLNAKQRAGLTERGIDLRWIDSSKAAVPQASLVAAFRAAVLGSASELLHKVEPGEIEGETPQPPSLPTMPAAGAEPDPSWGEPLPGLPLRPALLASLIKPEALWSEYPLLISDEGVRGLLPVFENVLEAMEADGEPAPILRKHVSRLVHAAAMLVERRPDPLALDDLLGPAGDLFTREIDLSDAGRAELLQEIDRFRSRLSGPAQAVGLSDQVLLTLYVKALEGERAGLRSRFRAEAADLVERLSERLRLDSRYGPRGERRRRVGPHTR